MDVTLIPGSGVGAQVADVMVDVVRRVRPDIVFDLQSELLPAIASVQRTHLAIKGKWASEIKAGQMPPSVQFRRALGVHTIVRHVANLPGLPARGRDIDICVVREASEDIYAGFEHQAAAGVFESVRVTTRVGCERVHRVAFALARAQGRRRVTTVHKANILKKADGMFLSVGKQVAAEFPDLVHDDVIVDALCMQLVRKPQAFDVLVCGNLFGDIVSDCAAGMAGGVTVACGKNMAPDATIFESPHGTTVGVVGADGANPYPFLGLAVDLLRHVGDAASAGRIRAACEAALRAGNHTQDMGGGSTCSAVHAAVVAAL